MTSQWVGRLLLLGGVVLSGSLQYEGWRFPVLAPTDQSNVAATIQLKFDPRSVMTKPRK